jgi:hypothetical protein
MGWRFWRWPLLAAAITLAVVCGVILLFLSRPRGRIDANAARPEDQRSAYITQGRASLKAGDYVRASRQLAAARTLLEHSPVLSGIERRRVERDAKLGALLADLLAESPVEILRHAVGLSENEWREAFRLRYAGKSILLDDTLHRDPQDVFHSDFRMRVVNHDAKIRFEDLSLLRKLPLNRPTRVVFAFRIASVTRDSNLAWMLHPDPDSGVLIHDPAVLSGTSLVPDGPLIEALRRQKEWFEDGL